MPRVPFREAKKRTPDRTINALVLPFGMALAAGMTTFVGVGLIAIGCKLPVKWPLILAGVVILLVMVIGFIWLFKKELIMTVETISNRDLDGDGVIGEPEPQTISIEVVNPDNRSLKYLHLPIPEEALRKLCVGLVVHQRPFSEAEWTGRGQPFSRAEFREIRAKLLAAGVIAWKDSRHKQQGIEFTAWGRRVMHRALESCVGTYAYTGDAESRLPRGQRGSVGLLEEGNE